MHIFFIRKSIDTIYLFGFVQYFMVAVFRLVGIRTKDLYFLFLSKDMYENVYCIIGTDYARVMNR